MNMKLLLYPNGEPKCVSYTDLRKMGQLKIQGKILMLNNKVYAHIQSMEE